MPIVKSSGMFSPLFCLLLILHCTLSTLINQASLFRNAELLATLQRSQERCDTGRTHQILENAFTRSALQCAQRCVLTTVCGAVNYQPSTTACILFDNTLFDSTRHYTLTTDDNWVFMGSKTVTFRKGNVGLEGGENEQKGRAMVSFGQWGTVCDDSFGDGGWPERFCVALGYNKADAVDARKTSIGIGSGHVAMQRPQCEGTLTIYDCLDTSEGPCGHDEDVFVTCEL